MKKFLAISILLSALVLGGCESFGGKSPSMEEWINLMQEHNSSGCVFVIGTYPPFAQARLYAQWGQKDTMARCQAF